MKKKNGAAEFMTWSIIWICVIFYAFALGVYATEKVQRDEQKQAEPAAVAVVDAAFYPETDEGALEQKAEAAACRAEAPAADLCEDSFLIEVHPLDYETQTLLYKACQEFGVDYDLALAVIQRETNFRNVKGDGGKAYGYFQIWPKWHKDRMEQLGVSDLMDPESNFRVGCHFLSECIEKYGLEKGLGYYNSGKAAETAYSRAVLEVYHG